MGLSGSGTRLPLHQPAHPRKRHRQPAQTQHLHAACLAPTPLRPTPDTARAGCPKCRLKTPHARARAWRPSLPTWPPTNWAFSSRRVFRGAALMLTRKRRFGTSACGLRRRECSRRWILHRAVCHPPAGDGGGGSRQRAYVTCERKVGLSRNRSSSDPMATAVLVPTCEVREPFGTPSSGASHYVSRPFRVLFVLLGYPS